MFEEAGEHKWHRVSPTEKYGRTHTSSVLVKTWYLKEFNFEIDYKDIVIFISKGSGPGGQHRNKTESAVALVHKPTNTKVSICNERSQHANKRLAYQILLAKLEQIQKTKYQKDIDAFKKEQIEKVKTYKVKENLVINHKKGTKHSLEKFLNGYIA